MLETAHSNTTVASDQCEPLQVVLPAELRRFFDESGYCHTTANEDRRNARMRVRHEARIEFLQIPAPLQAAFAAKSLWCAALIKDLSKSGVGILFHRQVFPQQVIRIGFRGREIDAVVVRCRRVADRCFEVGARISRVDSER